MKGIELIIKQDFGQELYPFDEKLFYWYSLAKWQIIFQAISIVDPVLKIFMNDTFLNWSKNGYLGYTFTKKE